jgi:hypothetical protein
MIQPTRVPTPNVTSEAQPLCDVTYGTELFDDVYRSTSAHDSSSEYLAGSVAEFDPARLTIAPTDWDLLFHAIQVRLESCANEFGVEVELQAQGRELVLQDRRATTRFAVLECVDAMKQLHASLTYERQAKAVRSAQGV